MAGKSLEDEERRALLDELSRIPVDADADDDVIRTFLPNPIYERALDQRVFIVRGERGAGKTAYHRNQVPRLLSGVEGLPKAKNADRNQVPRLLSGVEGLPKAKKLTA